MTLSEAITKLTEAGVDTPLHDAREIFVHALSLDRYMPIDRECDHVSPELEKMIERRAMREPLAYILGECWFYNEVYSVTDEVLVPRPDTEILVEFAVKNIPPGETFIDLCTGSGCVAISTLKNTEKTRALAVDISEGALGIARINADRNGVGDRLTLIRSDVLRDELPSQRVFAVLSNPPYIPDSVCGTLSPEVQKEPRIALAGGTDGLDFYKSIIPKALRVIDERGFIAFEIGYDEGDALRLLAEQYGLDATVINDYSKNDRVVVLKKK